MSALGIALVGAGGALAMWSALLLAGRGRPRRGEPPAFVVAGPYVRMRNPLYAGLLVTFAGLAVALGSGLLGLATVIALIAAQAWVVAVEEPRLANRFGSAYVEYLRRVPRWVPSRRRPRDAVTP